MFYRIWCFLSFLLMMWFACVVVWLLVAEGGCFYNAISFGKQLYIPGQYFSLMNFSKNTQALSDYFDVAIDYSLGQVAYADQGNSIYDFFMFERADYAVQEPCYYSTVVALNNLYSQFQPCQGGCNTFEAIKNFSASSTSLDLSGSQFDNLSMIVDNTFYPCNQGAYQSEVYLYQVLNLTMEQSVQYMFVLKIVFVILLQIFIFLFAYIVIMLQKLQNKKKKLKKIRQEEEDLDVLFSLQRSRNHD